MPFYNKTYRVKDGQMIPGTFLHAFVNNGHYYLTEVKIYKDGLIESGDFRPTDFDGFKEKVRQGRLVPVPPENARIGIGASALFFTAVDIKSQMTGEEFIKEVEDELRSMNKQPTSADICRAALQTYKEASTVENKEALRAAYEAVPRHRRTFLGDMDERDWEYRRILEHDQS